MAKPQRGLGKGLDALLGNYAQSEDFRKPITYVNSSPQSKPSAGTICMVDIDCIEPNPYQPRVTFDDGQLEELAASIRTLGLIQPITVRKISDDKYQIISGERRFRASRLAGLTQMPAYIREAGDGGMLEMAIVENVQRIDLDPIETALSYRRLIDECRLTQEEMADRIGKNRVTVTNFLRLLRLPAKVQYDVKVGNISFGHAKVLLGLEDEALQEKLSDVIIKEGLSVRALEQKIRDIAAAARKEGKIEDGSASELPDDWYGVLEIVGKYFDNNISLKRNSSGKGVMTIRFANDGQVSAFLKALKENRM